MMQHLSKAIKRALSDPSPQNIQGVTDWFWRLPDGDELQPLRFIVIAVRALQRRGVAINEANVINYLRHETYDMAKPCKRLLNQMKQ